MNLTAATTVASVIMLTSRTWRFDMKKILILFHFIILLSLASCNVLSAGSTSAPDQIATSVQQTLTALPISTTIAPVQSSSTASPTILPTNTSTPTETQVITDTPSPTNTIAPTMTATLSDDPKNSLGTPTWQNTLDNGTSFGLDAGAYEDDNTKIVITGGAMTLTSYSTIGYHGWRLTSPTPKNFYLEAVFKTQSCGGGDEYGIVFRAPDYSSGKGYYFGFRCTGEFNLFRWDDTGLVGLLTWTASPEILPGTGQTNRMSVLASGNSIKLFANGKLLTDVLDTKYSDGHFGVYISGYSGNLSVNMEEIAYWSLP
jgi:hypothetical protein